MFGTLTIIIDHYEREREREREREGTTTTCMTQFLFMRNLVYITEIEVQQRYGKATAL